MLSFSQASSQRLLDDTFIQFTLLFLVCIGIFFIVDVLIDPFRISEEELEVTEDLDF